MKRFSLLLLLSLTLCQGVRSQGARYDNFVIKPLNTGGLTAVSGALITVCTSAGTGTPCTPKVANIYSDEALTTPITGTGGAGTTNSDSGGNFGFYATPGSYIVTVTGTGITSYTIKVTLPVGNSTGSSGNETFAQINKTCYVDGVTNTTIPQALTCAGSGGSVYIPKSYSATIGSQINVTNPVSIIIDGASITFNAVLGFSVQASNVSVSCKNNSTITLTGSGASAFGIGDGAGGAISNDSFEGCFINGSGTVGLAQVGFTAANALITNLQIKGNTITNVNNGISLVEQPAAAGPGLIAPKVINNYIKGVYGSAVGTGYAITMGSSIVAAGAQTMQYMGGFISGNYIENAGRHSIYIAAGIGNIITNNYIKSHACISTPDGSLAAIPLVRKRGSIISNNTIDSSCDTAMLITGDNTFTGDSLISSEINVTGNNFINNLVYDIVIGNSVPATNGSPDHVSIIGNTIYNTSNNNYGIWFHCGKDIIIANNSIQKFTTNSYVIRFEEETETAGTANFTDRVYVRNNNIASTGPGDSGIGMSATAAGSGSNIWFTGNRINSTSQWFISGGGGITNPNVRVSDSDANFNASAFLTTVAYKPIQSWPLSFQEQAAIAAAAGQDNCYGDATAHALECSYNNGTFGVVPLLNRAQTWTAAQTHTGAAIIPDQTSGITGTTTNNNANAGAVGEYVQSVLATGSSVTLATGVTSNVTSISLTAGDWDVTGAVDFTFGATTSYTNLIGSVSSTSATIGGQDSKFDFETPAAVPTAGADATFPLPVVRFSLSGTTTVFLVAQGTFTVSTLKAYGTIRARRIR